MINPSRAEIHPRTMLEDVAGTPHGAILTGVLVGVRDHYRRAVAEGRLDDPVVVVEVLDRPPADMAELKAVAEAEGKGGVSVALGVQTRRWVARRLGPVNVPASRAVLGGPSPGCPMTVVVVSGPGITVVDLPGTEDG